MNERIRAREVRLVDEEGNQVGIVGGREALEIAREKGLDLIEVAPNANPPVCRIMNYGRYKYEQSKRDRDARKRSKVTEVKGVRIKSSRIDDHDYEVRVRDAIRFLKEGDKVKVSVNFKSREINHPELARELLQKMIVDTADYAVVEKTPSLEARTMTLMLSPRPNMGGEKKEASGRADKGSGDKAVQTPDLAAQTPDPAAPSTPSVPPAVSPEPAESVRS